MKMNYVSSALAVAALFTSTITFAADGIEALDQAWRQAITANDLNGIVACYARDAVLWAPDAPPAKGEEAIRKSYSDLLAANTVTNASLTNTHYQMCGDLSIGWGEFTLALAQVWSQSDYPVWPIYRRREEGRRQMALLS